MRGRRFRALVLVSLLFARLVSADEPATVEELRITTLSTMLTEFQGVGEWGFAALVEVDGQAILFDTGARPGTVLQNAEELGIPLAAVEHVILSHNHWDHTGGLVNLRRQLQKIRPQALAELHVARGIFLERELDPAASRAMARVPGEYLVDARQVRAEFEALGGTVRVHSEPYQLAPGVWLTGPVPRVHAEKNWTPLSRIHQGDQLVEDNIPEDQALVINTAHGLVVLTGCGHAGIVNIMEFAQSLAPGKPVHAVLGGFHLLAAEREQIAWTAGKLREFGVEHLVGAHCTGINPVADLRHVGRFDRESFVVGTVGTVYTLEGGIARGLLNR